MAPMQWETVAVPVVKGIDVNTRARLVDPQSLLEARNVRFPTGSGAVKRRGHSARRIRGAKSIPPGVPLPEPAPPSAAWAPYSTASRGIPEEWLFGYGALVDTGGGVGFDTYANSETALETSPHPDGALQFGAASRDSETLAWSGHELFSRTPGQDAGSALSTIGPAVMPSARVTPVAKTNRPQTQPDVADTGVIRVVAWLDAAAAKVFYSVYDSVTGAVLVNAADHGTSSPQQVRCLAIDGWVHVFTSVATAGGTVRGLAIHEHSPAAVTARSYGTCITHFDAVSFTSDNPALDTASGVVKFAMVRNRGDGTVQVTWHNADGTTYSTFPSSTPSIDPGTGVTALSTVAIAVQPAASVNGFALVWRLTTAATNKVCAAVYLPDGTIVGTIRVLATVTSLDRPVTAAPRYLLNSNAGKPEYNAYWDDDSAGALTVSIARFTSAADPATGFAWFYTETKKQLLLASRAFRVGGRTFIWAGFPSTLQAKWLLLDETLLPVGQCDYAQANIPASSAFPWIASVNWHGTAPVKDTLVFHCALGYRVRVASEDPAQQGVNKAVVYSEPAIQLVEMDFLPPLRAAQAGRTTYFAGAQLWAYDGSELVESGFHWAPEATAAVGGGALSYTYRVDLCYRNAQNEEIRSQSFFTNTVTNINAVISIKPVLTRRTNSYFLIFRNASAGTNWYLINSRDPTSSLFLANDYTQTTITLTDDQVSTPTDSGLISREFHPGNAFTYVEPVMAPASEIIASGHDRLWLAGGEIPAGQVLPSRLFEPGETPAFNPVLAVQVDRSTEPITAIGFVGDLKVFFRLTNTYIIDSDGPDNVLTGGWARPRLAYSDVGAVGQESLALISAGLVFQAASGIRLLTPGAGLQVIGTPVDAVARGMAVSAAIVVGKDSEVRWYSRSSDVLVFNYQYGVWSTWSCRAVGAALNPETDLAVLVSPDGSFWDETDGLYTDNSERYTQRVRFAWLRSGALMDYQRVRAIGAVGESSDAHAVHVDVYYNERDFAEESFDWTFPNEANDQSWNVDTFGSFNFGDGALGDNSATGVITDIRDAVWSWVRGLQRQKCSVISVAIDDHDSGTAGFVLTALALELGRKSGLDRVPHRGGTVSGTYGGADTISNGR